MRERSSPDQLSILAAIHHPPASRNLSQNQLIWQFTYQLPHDEPSTPTEPTRTPIDRGQVDLAMRLLPSTGWIGGLFGRRDRALLTAAAHTHIPYRQIAGLTVGQLHVARGVATITDRHGVDHLVESDESPVLCGPFALVRWRRLLDITVAAKTRMSEFLTNKAKDVTEASHHSCRVPQPIDPRTLEVSLFPPIDQWGHLAVQIRPLSPRSVSRLARQAETGLAAHRAIPVDRFRAVCAGAAAGVGLGRRQREEDRGHRRARTAHRHAR